MSGCIGRLNSGIRRGYRADGRCRSRLDRKLPDVVNAAAERGSRLLLS